MKHQQRNFKPMRCVRLFSCFIIFLLSCLVLMLLLYTYKVKETLYQVKENVLKMHFQEKGSEENAFAKSVLDTIPSRHILNGVDGHSDANVWKANNAQNVQALTDNTRDKYAFMQRLADDLQYKLEKVIPGNSMDATSVCGEKMARENSCQKTGCLRLTLPKNPIDRIKQLVEPSHLRVNDTYKEVLKSMGDSVPGNYDIILATGASSNHFEESKSLLSYLHAYVFPHLKNFTLIYYDLGLTKDQRDHIAQTCRCHLKEFPFSRFPKYFEILKCYAWKPAIVYAHLSHCNILHWMDSSIRFYEDFSRLEELYHLVRSRGLHTGANRFLIPRHTLQSMFHFFGLEACSFHHFGESTAGASAYHNEPLIFEAVVTPWLACAINESCMCPHKEVNVTKFHDCSSSMRGNRTDFNYAKCHRFDQSALGIILRTIYQEKSHHIAQLNFERLFKISRGDTTLIKT